MLIVWCWPLAIIIIAIAAIYTRCTGDHCPDDEKNGNTDGIEDKETKDGDDDIEAAVDPNKKRSSVLTSFRIFAESLSLMPTRRM
jgi:hypothetical protein